MFTRRVTARAFAASQARFTSQTFARRTATTGAFRFAAMAGGVASAAAFTGAAVFCAPAQCPYDLAAVKKAIADRLEDDLAAAPSLVRLAWHEAGTWDCKSKDGSPNSASMRHKPECAHAANAGLGKAREWLEPVKAQFPGISYADLWALAACVAIDAMGGPEVEFRWGRSDAKESKVPDGRLPDAALDENHVRAVFSRLGFNDRETVALIGAHAIGECHADASGYVGPWTHDKLGFMNSFFTELTQTEWIVDKRRPKLQYTDAPTKSLMMLPTDIALLFDKSYRVWVDKYAEDGDLFNADFAKAFKKLLELGVEHKLHATA
jgi:catalase (peroxidase I)